MLKMRLGATPLTEVKIPETGSAHAGAGAGALIRPIRTDRISGCNYWYAGWIKLVVNRSEG